MDVDALKGLVEENYGLKVKEILPFNKSKNDNYKVICEGGTFFLKSYQFDDPSHIDKIKFIRDALHENGVNVLIPLQTSSARDYISFEDEVFELYDFVESSDKMDPFSSLTQLSNFHKVLDGLDPSSVDFVDSDFFDQVKLLRAELLDHTCFFSKYVNVEWIDKILLRIINAKSELNLQLIHGDSHKYNYINNRDGSYIIDFERVRLGPKVFDLAGFLIYVVWKDKDSVNLDLFSRLVVHYLKLNSLDDFEMSFLFDMVVLAILSLIISKFIKNEDLSFHLLAMRLTKHYENVVRNIDFNSLKNRV